MSDEKTTLKTEATKQAAAEAPPKPPWEEKPVPPTHEEAMDDEDVRAVGDAIEGAVVSADRFAGAVTVTIGATISSSI